MTRCDYDALFYRVFCITLLGIAFTFTLILTNVFIDIDGILSRKQAKHKTHIVTDNAEAFISEDYHHIHYDPSIVLEKDHYKNFDLNTVLNNKDSEKNYDLNTVLSNYDNEKNYDSNTVFNKDNTVFTTKNNNGNDAKFVPDKDNIKNNGLQSQNQDNSKNFDSNTVLTTKDNYINANNILEDKNNGVLQSQTEDNSRNFDANTVLFTKDNDYRTNIEVNNDVIPGVFTAEPTFNEEGDNEDSYRTKRAIESQNILLHIKNPKIKSILTKKLTSMLEALDAEEIPENIKVIKNIQTDEQKDIADKEKKIEHDEKINKNDDLINKDTFINGDGSINKDELITKDERIKTDDLTNKDRLKNEDELMNKYELINKDGLIKGDDLMHMTMHNILLQGIIGHMDVDKVYKRVQTLMRNLNYAKEEIARLSNTELQSGEAKPQKWTLEDSLVEELMKCNELQDQIFKETAKNNVKKSLEKTNNYDKVSFVEAETVRPRDVERMPVEAKEMSKTDVVINPKSGRKVLIKTVIDIKSMNNDRNETTTKDNIHGIIELIYNGKSFKFTRPDVEIKQAIQNNAPLKDVTPITAKPITILTTESTTKPTIQDTKDTNNISREYVNDFVLEYFKNLPKDKRELLNRFKAKRLKRQISIKFEQDKNESNMSQQTKAKKKSKDDKKDDELYVEIETHFDSKGLKGDKKKKLITSLIEKIEKAIHSDDVKLPKVKNVDAAKNITIKKKKSKDMHIKKRLQNPLKQKHDVLLNKYSSPMSNIVHRQLNPITNPKTVKIQDNSPNVQDRSGEAWKKRYAGPTFLTETKAINSAEMGEVDVDYKRVVDVNGIPQRLQKPLNSEVEDDAPQNAYDLGNMKFFIKDIDGSGFSVGFNQFVDETPDPESMKLFTGLESILRTYHQNYDQDNKGNLEADDRQEMVNEHMISKRSIHRKKDYHSNEYRMIYDTRFMPFKDYKEIVEGPHAKAVKKKIEKKLHKRIHNSRVKVDDNIFEKKLKPAEIFNLANLLRKKRSLNVKRISNLRNKIKLNRFLNTNAKPTRKIFLSKRRNKRQINKIRIIASDIPHKDETSSENVFVVSDENVFADRAIVKDVETSEAEADKPEPMEYIPNQTEESQAPTYSIFDGSTRHNTLMSKYPHIFMEEISKTRDEFLPNDAVMFGKIQPLSKAIPRNTELEQFDHNASMLPVIQAQLLDQDNPTNIEEIVNALQVPKNTYKVTVKISPKNGTGGNTGYKEVHTSINKRYNKNGLMYSSLVNVSELTNIIKINKTNQKPPDSYLANLLREQHQRMQELLRQHQKNINEQLIRLNMEKENLETILSSDNFTIKFPEPEITTPVPITETTTEVPTTTTSTTVATTTTTATSTTHPIKDKLIHTIQKNENLTDQILKKIDKNTETLQRFLKKLINKIENQKKDAVVATEATNEKTLATDATTQDSLIENSRRLQQFATNVIFRNNDTHIPFLYTYQGSTTQKNGLAALGKMSFHGHIHTNVIPESSLETNSHKHVNKMADVNQTRFFIDDLESDYKILPVHHENSKNATL
ncbi:uncharacterized protein LOC142984797 [Anticarsia gemmatalis]|uniref:uncharacterized protein LOC142984797 n=1 Tax=Anticarsia gemmatalis TaxID=129554 RepID=UPI003F77158A